MLARVRTAIGSEFDLSDVERLRAEWRKPVYARTHRTGLSELRRKTGANPGNARVATRNDGPGCSAEEFDLSISAPAGPE